MILLLLIARRGESSIATAGLLATAVLVFTLLPAQAQRAVVPEKDIASALVRQVDSFDLVGLGELHGSLADQELRIKIIHHKDFASKVHNVVMEGLNSLYQEELDRYLNGEDVPNNNGAGYFGTGDGSGSFVFQSLFWSPGYDVVEPQDVNGDGKADIILYNSTTVIQQHDRDFVHRRQQRVGRIYLYILAVGAG
jgi:hypothetical protein